jgi:site-specific recombinase XerD
LGGTLEGSRTMMNEFDEFARYLTEQDKATLTVRGYLADIRIFSRWFRRTNEEDLKADNWVSGDVRAYKEALLDKSAKPQTINRHLASLVSFGNWAVQDGQIESNPALHIRSVATAPLSPKWLEKREKAALLRAMERDLQVARKRYPRLWVLRLRDAAIMTLLLNTGLRVGELCALRLSDAQMSERKGKVIVRSGKGGKQRIVPLNRQARQMLSQWLLHRPPVDTDTLFVGQRNNAVSARSVQRAVGRLAQAAGLEDVTPHILRHTFAKSLIDQGVSIEKVAALLGHSDLNTTRIYITPGERDLEEAVGRLSS